MAELFTVLFGKNKQNMRPIMTDTRAKCENYVKARENTFKRKLNHQIVPAEAGAKVWRKNTSNQWTGYNDSGPGKS